MRLDDISSPIEFSLTFNIIIQLSLLVKFWLWGPQITTQGLSQKVTAGLANRETEPLPQLSTSGSRADAQAGPSSHRGTEIHGYLPGGHWEKQLKSRPH